MIFSSSEALAQPRPPARPSSRPSSVAQGPRRGFLTVGAGGQFGAGSFSESQRRTVYAEAFTWDADYPGKAGPAVEVGGGWRVWRDLYAAATYSYSQHSGTTHIEGQVPHPFFFNQPRDITGEAAGLGRQEQAIHVSALWNVPVGRRFVVGVFGGPSYLRVSQELVQDVLYTEAYPFDVATFSQATLATSRKGKVGAHAGVDVTWPLTPRLGVGATVRYAWTGADLATPAGGSLRLDVGGLQTLVGLRVGFLSKPPPRVTPPRARPAPRR